MERPQIFGKDFVLTPQSVLHFQFLVNIAGTLTLLNHQNTQHEKIIFVKGMEPCVLACLWFCPNRVFAG